VQPVHPGIIAERRDWLRRLPTVRGMLWLTAGLGAALPYAATILSELTAGGAAGRVKQPSLLVMISSPS
jgi:hypothetical protein